MGNLTVKQDSFAKAYVKNGGNGAKAARQAGYTHDRQRAYDCVTNRYVQERIQHYLQETLTAANLKPEHILNGLIKEAGLDGSGGSDNTQPGSRIRALELIGKTMSMFKDVTVTEEPQLTGLELILKLAVDDCPAMAVGAAIDLGLCNFQTEAALRAASPDTADLLLEQLTSASNNSLEIDN